MAKWLSCLIVKVGKSKEVIYSNPMSCLQIAFFPKHNTKSSSVHNVRKEKMKAADVSTSGKM